VIDRDSHSPRRRRLLLTASAVTGLVFLEPLLSACSTPGKKLPLEYAEQYQGIYIATQPEPVLKGNFNFRSYYTHLDEDPNEYVRRNPTRTHDHAWLTTEEENIIKSAIRTVPYAQAINDMIITYRNGRDADGNSFEMKGFHLSEGWYQELHWGEQVQAPFQARAIMLVTDSSIDYSQPLSPTRQAIGQNTIGDALEGAVIHEYGHALIDEVKRSETPNCDDLPDDGLPKIHFPLGSPASRDINHPLIKTFATVTNWSYGTNDIAVSQGSPGSYMASADEKCVWINPWIEVNTKDKSKQLVVIRQLRVSEYGTVNLIEEAFAEFFRASIQARELLTDPERRYFDILHNGMTKNPNQMIEEIRRNPQILLR